MRLVLVITATICSALARPDVSHGYNYERGGGDNFIGAVPFQNNQIGGGGLNLLTQSGSSGSTYTATDFSGGIGIGLGTGGITGGGITGGGISSGLDFGRQQQNLKPIVTKNFYIHSAPDDVEEQNAVRTIQLGRPQKTYRVVFIKAPGAGSRSASIQAIYPKNEEKTVIYVLSQKADEVSIGDIATPAPSAPSKPEVFFIKYKTAEEAALAQQQIKDGWRALRDSKRLQMWDYKKALIHLQTMYGSFPFFKICVENRVSYPYGKIITIDEGEVGLPHKMFYSLDNNNKVINAYKLLLRDFAINMGMVVEDAKLFANEIFHYEQRIVSETLLRQESSDNEPNQIMTLGEIKKVAPSLPVFESVQAIFSKTKITEKTEVLVRSVDILEAMSIIVSTSDKQPLNDFIIWSLARKYAPYMSREYRASLHDFEKVLHGHIATPPKWYFCAKTIRDWVPFAVDVLKQNPDLISQTNTHINIDRPQSDYLVESEDEKNVELLRLMFYHIRNKLQESIENANWINQDGRHFLTDKLSNIKLQIGIPKVVLESNTYINEHYEDLLLQNLFFVEHLEPFWSFAKRQMEKKLKPSLNTIDVIVNELYPGYGHQAQLFTFNALQNIAIISKSVLQPPYFHYKYPLAFNYARTGTNIAELLLRMIFLHSEQYNNQQKTSNSSSNSINLIGDSIECLNRNIEDKSIPNKAITKLYLRISSINIASNSLQSFLKIISNGDPISGASTSDKITYHDLDLDRPFRQPGMRKFEDDQTFALAELQRYCSVTSESYSKFKPYIEENIPESESFMIMWNHLDFLPSSLSCSIGAQKCSDIL